MNYEIKRAGVTVATVTPKGVQDKLIMAQNKVDMNFELNSYVDFFIGDYVDVYGERYWLNVDASVKEESSIRWVYTLPLQAIPFDLIRTIFFMYDDQNQLKEPVFDLTGDMETFLDLIITNLSRFQVGWVKGNVDPTDVKTLSFNSENCMAVLSRLAEEFQTEYWFDGQTIHLTKRGEVLNTTLEQGKGKGLRKIERVPLDNKSPITRLYVFGSEQNLPSTYRNGSKRLKLPLSVAPNYYLEKNVDLYREREDTYINEDIFPRRKGKVTNTTAINNFTDTALDFDINLQLIPGTSAKVKFLTGQLAGYQFEIANGGYNHTTKTITILANKDEKAFTVPSDVLRPSVGDEWVLLDIKMPDSYIFNAENELLAAGLKQLNEVNGSRFNYLLTTDPFHFARTSTNLSLGKYIRLKSTEFNVDNDIRIVGYTRDLQNPYEYPTVQVSSFLQFHPAVIADSQQRAIERAVQINKLSDIVKARNNRKSTKETLNMMFNPETGKLYPETIEAGSITAQALSIGTKSQDFKLTNILKPNARLDVNRIDWTTGRLIHYLIEANGGVWTIAAGSVNGLTASKAYYIYAKCDKASLFGTLVITEAQIKVEDVAGYYHFWVGVLNSVVGGYRVITSTAGATDINGGQITTGIVKSNNGEAYFDLNENKLYAGNATKGIDWNVSKPNTLTIRGAVSQNAGGIEAPIPVFRGAYNAASTYYQGDTVTYLGSTWSYINSVPKNGQTPAENAYWTVVAKAGQNGNDGLPGAAGTSTFFHVAYSDSVDGTLNFNQNSGKYIGTYVDFTQSNSNDPAKYKWVLLKGADGIDGTDGIPGSNGIDGKTSYLHIKYSNDGGLTFTANAGEDVGTHIGQYVDFILADSTNVGDYKWALIKGANGTNGTNGIDGNYTEFRFAKNGSPSEAPNSPQNINDPLGWSTEQPSLMVAQYLWMVQGLKSGTGNLIGSWSTPVRFTAVDGSNGTNGKDAPYLTNRGNYDNNKIYVGNAKRIEAVQYLGDWYVTRVDAGNIPVGRLPTNTDYFNPFGGQFESVATGLLLAQLAYIENLGVRYLATDAPGTKRVEINGELNNIRVLDANNAVLIDADDDSAVESISFKPNDPPLPPTIKYNYGPGVKVGDFSTVAGASSMGRKGVLTNGFYRKINQATGAVQFEVEADGGKVNANNGLEVSGDTVLDTVKVKDGGEIKTGWSGTITTIRASNGQVSVKINAPTPTSILDKWTRSTYKNGILVNLENEII
ncbi:phage tail protein [Pedobacter suwonensis]|uniref:phage tail protein n=1 Tax=Pedobacter suwonensis TaxID=332999 RepID=UPI0011A37D24|nr:phage tail protein [Pedobacter suwonensis]